MGENGSGAGRPPKLPPHPAGAGPAVRPLPPARNITAARQALRQGSHPAAKPEPEPPAKANSFKETLGETAYENLKATLTMLCRVSGLSMHQFKVTRDELLFFRNPSSPEHSRFARIEFLGGRPELRIYFEDIGWGPGNHEACRAILRECGHADVSETRVLLFTGMRHLYIRIADGEVSICASKSREGQPSLYMALRPG